MDKEPGKMVKRKRPAPCAKTLRREALRQLKERLEGGELSTGDLLKIMGMNLPEEEKPAPTGDWVLVVGEEEG